MSVQLTPNFTVKELTVTNRPYDNTPSKAEIEQLRLLAVNILQPLRDALGKPVIVNSAYRGEQVNKAVGGVPTSQHRLGQAADIRVTGMSPLELCHFIISLGLPFDQLIEEGTWTHVSFGPRNRRQVLTMRNGKYTAGIKPLPGANP
ncbi:peptidase [Stenotrophomonas phage Siara]|uniref:Endolysin endopeptidase n=1 Tax=Stenotrophomonas phage Siara TaxID=2859658 RepID=A0AAE7WM65_9CAUD|nr:peptidase [Stenotrophomonas phage Siara]QYW02029.1 endolysin endopeptidase [Stenotrophomonas phage Siara]